MVCSVETTVQIGTLWRLEVSRSAVFWSEAFLFAGVVGIVSRARIRCAPLLDP